MEKLRKMFAKDEHKRRKAKNFKGTRLLPKGCFIWKLDMNGDKVPVKVPYEVSRTFERTWINQVMHQKVMELEMGKDCHYTIALNQNNACRKFARTGLPVQNSKGQVFQSTLNANGHISTFSFKIDPEMIDRLKSLLADKTPQGPEQPLVSG